MYIRSVIDSYNSKSKGVFGLKLFTEVLFNVYIHAVTSDRFRLDHMEFRYSI